MSWGLEGAIAVAVTIALIGAATGLLRPRDASPDAARQMRYLGIALTIAFLVFFTVRLLDGEGPWRSFVCAANPIASQHDSHCRGSGMP